MVRGIVWPIRDENWGTYATEIIDEQIEDDGNKFSAKLRFSVAEGELECDLEVTALAVGEVHANLKMTPVGEPFLTNRAGFTVLHPIQGTAGRPLAVVHSDDKSEQTVFPRLISHIQPVMDIQELTHSVNGVQVDISFEGEIFEMEDQRNWSDASYKTYCVPLVYPFTYPIKEPISQSSRFTFSGAAPAPAPASRLLLDSRSTKQVAPRIGMVLQPGWMGDESQRTLVAKVGAAHYLLRLDTDVETEFLLRCAKLSGVSGAEIDAEIILDDTESVDSGLTRMVEKLSDQDLHPTHAIALPKAYLKSHQPSGPWPEGATPTEVCLAAKKAFPKAKIGGGMLTNFTELNRCPPEPAHCDYIFHSSTALVHASDDLSVLETLETLPRIFESAAALADDKAYRLGLMSIGMRSNPYGEDVADNPNQIRRTMAREDPRHRGLFGAAWAVGVLAATEDSAVEALCLAAPTGPFGVVYAPQHYPQVGYEDDRAAVYPLYHVVRAACQMSGLPRLTFSGLPDGIAVYGVQHKGANDAIFANVTDGLKTVPLAQQTEVVVLDTDNFQYAVTDADWLTNVEKRNVTQLELDPFAVAFATWST